MRVLIVGAGVAGLALARALRQQGTTAEVVERVAEWEPSGAGLYLPGNAMRALDELGVGAAVAAVANPIGRQRILDHRGGAWLTSTSIGTGTASAPVWRSIARRCTTSCETGLRRFLSASVRR